ncbi:uncharacterized protein [Nicotiana sylvestris]|uniref:uncharacterized protein n=1 Tax=Nicotiana sylvestris TaxID=4096 RepID=UPI00388C94E8
MAPYKAFYGRRSRSLVGWLELGEARLLGTNLVRDILEKVNLIQEQLHIAQSRKKSYADKKARDVAYMVGEKVLLKVLPMKCVMRFGKKELLWGSVTCIRLQHGAAGREFDLWCGAGGHFRPAGLKIEIKEYSIGESLIESQPVEEASWEIEQEIWSRYPYLFETPGMILDS